MLTATGLPQPFLVQTGPSELSCPRGPPVRSPGSPYPGWPSWPSPEIRQDSTLWTDSCCRVLMSWPEIKSRDWLFLSHQLWLTWVCKSRDLTREQVSLVCLLKLLLTKAGQIPLDPKSPGFTLSTAGSRAPSSTSRRYFFPAMTVMLITISYLQRARMSFWDVAIHPSNMFSEPPGVRGLLYWAPWGVRNPRMSTAEGMTQSQTPRSIEFGDFEYECNSFNYPLNYLLSAGHAIHRWVYGALFPPSLNLDRTNRWSKNSNNYNNSSKAYICRAGCYTTFIPPHPHPDRWYHYCRFPNKDTKARRI